MHAHILCTMLMSQHQRLAKRIGSTCMLLQQLTPYEGPTLPTQIELLLCMLLCMKLVYSVNVHL